MEASQNAGPSSSTADKAPPTPDSGKHVQEFLSSGRTGRRNALPDILGQHASVTSSDLPSKLQALTTTDASTSADPQNQPGSSKSWEKCEGAKGTFCVTSTNSSFSSYYCTIDVEMYRIENTQAISLKANKLYIQNTLF